MRNSQNHSTTHTFFEIRWLWNLYLNQSILIILKFFKLQVIQLSLYLQKLFWIKGKVLFLVLTTHLSIASFTYLVLSLSSDRNIRFAAYWFELLLFFLLLSHSLSLLSLSQRRTLFQFYLLLHSLGQYLYIILSLSDVWWHLLQYHCLSFLRITKVLFDISLGTNPCWVNVVLQLDIFLKELIVLGL